MIRNLGPQGILGIVVVLVGVVLVALADPQIAAGIALVLVGLAVVVKSLISGMLSAWGMA